jgi:hypothetical protein
MGALQKSTRGGARKGAGRKPKSQTASTRRSEIQLRAAAAPLAQAGIERKAQRACDDVLTQTERVMLHSSSDPARIKAAAYILDRAFGLPTTSTGVDMTLPLFDQEFLAPAPGRITDRCSAISGIALETLIKISQNSSSPTARLAAAKAIHSRGLGAISPASLSDFGSDKVIDKKQAALDAAELAGASAEWATTSARAAKSEREKSCRIVEPLRDCQLLCERFENIAGYGHTIECHCRLLGGTRHAVPRPDRLHFVGTGRVRRGGQ